ncbi:hypothetical protein N5923_23320 [Erwiniaceae bacterium BAC15a-03b]|uniref:Uncharacterized protein n=1 Tax=Winslowiella arboricola TaxID=2978220 RepID=A0A9J6PSI6_9GAMM|nr:hypothetical protein [Winslowiella arboricola]MCU5775120.1 hypothetical protein [Winslowiella arboricola]MCU5780426.1 hypothetical protein [Winslowiella arboricola]
MTTFSGGEALEQKLAEIAEKLGEGKTLRVGFLEGATYPDNTSVPMVAAANEFGDPAMNRPPRPFFRNMIADKSPEWGDDIGKIAIAVNYDASALFSLMGERIKDQLQGSIRELTDPPLSPYTIKKKGFDKPLIETSHMLNSVDYDVKDGV